MTNHTANQALAGVEQQLWLPKTELALELQPPTQEELLVTFAQTVASGTECEPVAIDAESLSAMLPPRKMPRGFLLVDIDDTVGDLAGSLQALQYTEPMPTAARYDNHDYGEGKRRDGRHVRSDNPVDYESLFFNDSEILLKYSLIALIKGSEAGMRPVENVEAIRQHLMYLRSRGVYVTFVTASTPGAEIPTVGNFLGRYFQGAADGVVITSGHYTIADKGRAAVGILGFVEKTLGEPLPSETPVAAIDDWPTHTAKIRTALAARNSQTPVQTIQYVFPSSQPHDQGSQHVATAPGRI